MKTQVIKINKYSPEPEIIKQAVDILIKGGLVAIPTETVYGLAANANNQSAIEKLCQAKNRPKDKHFTILISSIEGMEDFAVDILPVIYRLADNFWPGPLTLVLKYREPQDTQGKEIKTIGLRMPKSNTALEIIKQIVFPIACPSANLSGNKEPLTAQDVLGDLDGKIDLILDAGKTEIGVSSTVIDAREIPFKILRQGFIKEEKIKEISSKKRILFVCTGNTCRSVMAKALLEKRLREKNRQDIEVSSAGVMAIEGSGASLSTKMLLSEEGIDVSNHSTQNIKEGILKRCDLILAMESIQEQVILTKYPQFKKRVYLLKEFSQFKQDNLEIRDPVGQDMNAYRKVFLDIKEAIERLVDLI